MIKKVSLLLFIFCLSGLFFQARAVSPTPESETTPSKIKEIREAVKEKVREKIEEVKQGQKKAFVGEITNLVDSTITLVRGEKEQQVQIDEETNLIDKGRQPLAPEALETGVFAIAMGYLDEAGVLQAKRLVIVEKPQAPVREVAFGQVEDLSEASQIITIKNVKKDLIYTVETTNQTKITKKMDGKIQAVKFEDIAIDDRLVAIGTPAKNENKIITAKIIHVIPGKALGQIKTTPTPEPEPTEAEEPSPAPTTPVEP